MTGLWRWMPNLSFMAKKPSAGKASDGGKAKPRGRKPAANLALLAVGLGFAAAGGYSYYSKTTNTIIGTAQSPKTDVWDAPWWRAPEAPLALQTCERLHVAQSLAPAGWRHDSADCGINGTTLTSIMHWSRVGGLNAELEAELAGVKQPLPMVGAQSSDATASLVSPALPVRQREGLWTEYELRRTLNDLFLASSVKVSFTLSTQPNTQISGENTLRHEPGQFAISVTDEHRSFDAAALRGIPGIVLTEEHITKSGSRIFNWICYFKA